MSRGDKIRTRIISHDYYPSIMAYVLGVLTVVFAVLLSGAVDNSIKVVDLSSRLANLTRLASVGLGVGYYFGTSLKQDNSELSWFLFGVFSSLTVLSLLTIDTLIFGRFPAYSLLLSGTVVTIVALATPLVYKNEEYVNLIRYVAGYASSLAVVLLAVSKYIVTLLTFITSWTSSLDMVEAALLAVLILGVSYIVHGATVKIRNDDYQREIDRQAKRKVARIIAELRKEEVAETRETNNEKSLKERLEDVVENRASD